MIFYNSLNINFFRGQDSVELKSHKEALEIFDEMIGLPEYRGEQQGYDLYYYSHGAGICVLLKLIEPNPEIKSFIFMTRKGLHSNARELYEFQKYFRDFIAKEMPGC